MNDLSKILSRLFTAIASLEKFISKRKVIHIILTFCRENGANTTFLIKSHDTKKVGIITKERTGGGLNKRAVLLPPYSAHFRFFRIEQSRVWYGDPIPPASIG